MNNENRHEQLRLDSSNQLISQLLSQNQHSSTDADEFARLMRKGLNLGTFRRSIVRNFWLTASIVGLVSGLAALRYAAAPPTYLGEFQLLVEPLNTQARVVDPLTVTRTGNNVPSENSFGLDYPSQIAVLRSPAMMESIVQEVQKSYPDFNVGQLQQGLTVARMGLTSADFTKILRVSFSHSDPQLVEAVLQETAERYLQYSLEDRKTRYSEGIKFVEDRLPELQERVSLLQDQLQDLQEEYNLVDPKEQGNLLSEEVSQIALDERETRKLLREQVTLYNSLRQQLNLTPEEAIAASTLSEEPGYLALQQQMQELERQIATESAQFSEESPILLDLRARQRNLSSLMSQELQRILGQNLGQSTGNPRVQAFQNSVRLKLIEEMVAAINQIRVLQARSEEIAGIKAQIENRFREFPGVTRRYSEILRQLEISNRSLDQLLTQRETFQIESAQTEVPWELVSPPTLPKDGQGRAIPFAKSQNELLGAIAASVLLGLLAAILLDRLRDTFFRTEDVQDAIDLPVIGVVPHDPNADSLQPEALLRVAGDRLDSSLFKEAFSSLYANLCFMSDGAPIRSLTVCSASPSEGKTTIALHLAHAAASMGKRVLLVDGNFRHADLHQRLRLGNDQGLSDVLLRGLQPDDLIQSTSVKNLLALTTGTASLEALRLLGSEQMQNVMLRLHQTYDLVIYDAPHLLGLTDAEFISANTDGILMVVSVQQSKRSHVMQALQSLMVHRLPSLGVVVNHPDPRAIASLGYYNTRPRPLRRQARMVEEPARVVLNSSVGNSHHANSANQSNNSSSSNNSNSSNNSKA